ncbi:MAG: response regulator [Anaerosomatales bacterium]|nr:response regulator [Anaerosomatales bacterium]
MAGERVLVVEDTELLRRMYHDKLVQDGYVVGVAGDGIDALAKLRAEKYDLVVLDLIMPRMGGLEVLETIKADPNLKSVPVLILTNLGEEGAIERALDLGALDYLIKNQAKPADVAEKIRLTLDAFGTADGGVQPIRVVVKDREADAERLIEHAKLVRRLWCPACEVELALELFPKTDKEGWYDAHIVCPMCGREY